MQEDIARFFTPWLEVVGDEIYSFCSTLYASFMRIWFISHASGAMSHTPVFFSAVQEFAQNTKDIQLVLPHSKSEDVHLTKQSIQTCELVIVEISIPSTGSGIELGWANAANKPIIAFNQGGSQVSPAIKFVTNYIYTYITTEDIVKILTRIYQQGSTPV